MQYLHGTTDKEKGNENLSFDYSEATGEDPIRSDRQGHEHRLSLHQPAARVPLYFRETSVKYSGVLLLPYGSRL